MYICRSNCVKTTPTVKEFQLLYCSFRCKYTTTMQHYLHTLFWIECVSMKTTKKVGISNTKTCHSNTAIDHAHTMGRATHTYMKINIRTNTCTNLNTRVVQLTTPTIPTIPQLTILTKFTPRGVWLGARTCIVTI